MSHAHHWTYFYVPGDAFRYCSCGAREVVDPDGKTRPVAASQRSFVESRIKKMEKNAWHSLWTKLASAPLIGGGVGALGGAAFGYYRHRDDEDPWRYAAGHALLGGAIGATVGAGWRDGRSDKLQAARQAGQQKALDTLGVPSTLKVAPHEVVLPPSPPAAPSAAPVRRVNPLELSPEEFHQALLDPNTHWEF
jgi:hypothetical protein